MKSLNVALVGNPNCGKTALFNLLTGSRQKVANYAGVTVERKEGHFVLDQRQVRILDLPGAYSLKAASPDEEITREICMGNSAYGFHPDVLVCVVDATNLRLHLRFVLELKALGKPMLVALNMMDAAEKRGITIDVPALSAALGVPVVPTVAVSKHGADALKAALAEDAFGLPPLDWNSASGQDSHQQVRRILDDCVSMPRVTSQTDDRLDRWLLHPVLGPLVLFSLLFFMFQAVYAWAAPFQDGISASVAWLSDAVGSLLPQGILLSLIQDGIFAGLGTVLEFLPQILILFAFILALEETGYLPRAAFLLDRVMFLSGLTGRSFIPLLSSYACAIPGIMATRSIQDPRDRLATIMVAPLTTCSARLPVYTLLIGAFIPETEVAGVFNLQGLVLFGLYLFGILSVFAVAWVMKMLSRRKSEHALLLELPSYRMPNPRDLAIAEDRHLEAAGQRVGHADAHAVQAAAEAVGAPRALVELAAGVQPREDDLDDRQLFLGVQAEGNAAPVVVDAHRAVAVQRHGDAPAVARERLVRGVVDDLLHHVQRVVGPRVHAGPLLDRLQALEHAYRRFAVGTCGRGALCWRAGGWAGHGAAF